MRITFLGTSAASSCPLPFCHCATCTEARKFGGKDFRKRSSILINDDLLIDFGPDIMTSSFMHNVMVDKIHYWLQTHSHADHFDASHVITRIPEYCSVKIPTLNLYASKACLEKMSAMLRKEWDSCDLFNSEAKEHLNLNIEIVDNLHTFTAGNYKITAFSSDHDKLDNSLLYSVQENNYSVFYGTDTNAFSEDIWKGFHMKGLQFDIVILDHTYGENVGGVDHLNANQFALHVKRFREEGLLKKNARIFATHISHEGNPTHSGLVEFGIRFGYEIAYDGLIIN